MSEAERIRRLNYKRNRKRWILAQIIILAIVVSIALGSFLIYKRLDRTYYIEYTENSSSDYSVHYKENTFFEEEWLGSGQSYVSSLVDYIDMDFNYKMNMDTSNVAFDYTYTLTAQLVISDKTSGAHIYDPVDVLIEETKKSVSGSDNFNVSVGESIDFSKYNSTATKFINVYGLKNAKAALWVTLKVNVLSASDEFEMNNENTHSVTMLVPLCELNFSIENTTSLPAGESKVLACKRNNNQKLFLGCSIATSVLAAILLVLLAIFAYLTKNEDVTYANRVRKIMSAYRSFIQRIYGEFDSDGYQIVQIKTFMEMLSIRDTIQSPVLMSENKDETRAQFIIPTNTKIIYLYEIKVDNYDELYGAHPEWVDDSIIKLETERKEEPVEYIACDDITDEFDIPEDNLATDTPEESEAKDGQPTQVIIDLYAEIEKLRSDIEEKKHQLFTPVPVTVEPCTTGGPMKFGNFTAGGNVTINYHEMPDKETLKEVSKLIGGNRCAFACQEEAPKTDEAPADITDDKYELIIEEEPVAEVEPTECELTDTVEEIAEPAEEIAEPVEEIAEPAEEIAEPVEEIAEPVEEIAEPAEEAADATAEPSAEVEYTAEDLEGLFETVPELEEEVVESDSDTDTEANEDSDSEGGIVFYDENENKLVIRCRRSCLANIIQSENEFTKAFYSELKNYILSFKGVKARMSWRHESFNKGRQQLFKLKVRGKTICLYCALNPEEYDVNKYFHKTVESKTFEQVPMLVRIKSPGALKRAKKLVDAVMERYEIRPNASYTPSDFVAAHPYERTQALIDQGLIKILIPDGYVVADPRHIVKAEALKKMIEARKAKKAAKEAALAEATEATEPTAVVEEAQPEIEGADEVARLTEEVRRLREYQKSIEDALASPDMKLEDIHYIDEVDREYQSTEEKPGVEVVNVVWRERERNNKLHHYSPNGAKLSENDIVLIPTKDEKSNADVIKKATVAHGNHTVDPDTLKNPLKTIFAVLKQKMEDVLSQDEKKPEPKKDQKSKLGTVHFVSDEELKNGSDK